MRDGVGDAVHTEDEVPVGVDGAHASADGLVALVVSVGEREEEGNAFGKLSLPFSASLSLSRAHRHSGVQNLSWRCPLSLSLSLSTHIKLCST